MNQAELVSEYMTFYYQRPDPGAAPAMLDGLVELGLARPRQGAEMPGAYFFGRIGHDNPEVAAPLDQILTRKGVVDTPFGRLMRAVTQDPDTATAGLLDRAPRSPEDCDILWADFFLTGQARSVVRLIDALDEPDAVRVALTWWLRTPPSRLASLLGPPRHRTLARIGNEIGIVTDANRQVVVTESDCDLRCLLDGLALSGHRFRAAKRCLPFSLNGVVLQSIQVKTSSAWSLAQNAVSHQAVFETVRQEAPSRAPRTRITLLEVMAHVARANLRSEDARVLLHEAISLDPTRAELRQLVADLPAAPTITA